MSRIKKWKMSINWIVVFILIVLPKFIVQLSINYNFEIYGKFIALSVITVLAPLGFLWYSLSKKTDINHEMPLGNKKSVKYMRAFGLVIATLGLYFLTFNYIKDGYLIANHEVPTLSGNVVNIHRPGKSSFIFGYQAYGIDDPSVRYFSFFSSEMFGEGDHVKIWYTPYSHIVLKAEKVSP